MGFELSMQLPLILAYKITFQSGNNVIIQGMFKEAHYCFGFIES
jgi:hypothetical protein